MNTIHAMLEDLEAHFNEPMSEGYRQRIQEVMKPLPKFILHQCIEQMKDKRTCLPPIEDMVALIDQKTFAPLYGIRKFGIKRL